MMIDPLSMFCGGPVNPIGLAILDESEDRAAAINNIIAWLQKWKRNTLQDACIRFSIRYSSLTQQEKEYIKSQAPWLP